MIDDIVNGEERVEPKRDVREGDFRGPEGRIHIFGWRKDCWRGRPEGCCLACHGRLILAGVKCYFRRR